MMAPARLFTPTAATLAGASDPAFCREPCVERHPAPLAGDTRLMNDDANWAATVSQGTRPGTPPISAIALAT